MRSCYDNLLSVAAAIANSAYGIFLVQFLLPLFSVFTVILYCYFVKFTFIIKVRLLTIFC